MNFDHTSSHSGATAHHEISLPFGATTHEELWPPWQFVSILFDLWEFGSNSWWSAYSDPLPHLLLWLSIPPFKITISNLLSSIRTMYPNHLHLSNFMNLTTSSPSIKFFYLSIFAHMPFLFFFNWTIYFPYHPSPKNPLIEMESPCFCWIGHIDWIRKLYNLSLVWKLLLIRFDSKSFW